MALMWVDLSSTVIHWGSCLAEMTAPWMEPSLALMMALSLALNLA